MLQKVAHWAPKKAVLKDDHLDVLRGYYWVFQRADHFVGLTAWIRVKDFLLRKQDLHDKYQICHYFINVKYIIFYSLEKKARLSWKGSLMAGKKVREMIRDYVHSKNDMRSLGNC